jgi:hypothetical protein
MSSFLLTVSFITTTSTLLSMKEQERAAHHY